MKLIEDEGPYVFPIETQVYWKRLEGMGLKDSFLVQLDAFFEELRTTIKRDLHAVTVRPGALNADYDFTGSEQMEEFEVEVPQVHDLEDKALKDLLEGMDGPVKPGGKEQ